MLSESPGTPGRRQQMPRTIRSIRTPASLAVVQLLDQAAVHEPVHLRDDPRGSPSPGVGRLAADALEQPVAQVARARAAGGGIRRARVTRQEIEELRQVLAERVAAREEPEVAVDAARPHVVVAGGEMAVAPEPSVSCRTTRHALQWVLKPARP